MKTRSEVFPVLQAQMPASPLDLVRDELTRPTRDLPNAITLATVDAAGRPRARVVLLKEVDDRGVVFFSNYESDKSRDLEANPHAAVAVYWHETLTQVRVAGRVEKLTEAESDAYFATRPRGSQIGAWASDQSRPLEDFDDLKRRVAEVERQYEGQDVPRPPHWGGWRIVADDVEIWKDGEFRLHRRERYRLGVDGTWSMTLLNP
ncbi:MAG: pyridoxamine 5'-phosphate oxidase [Planctomycetota bacterium]